MITIESLGLAFSKDEIQHQLQKITSDPIFAVSDILQRFLIFITEETLEGRSNQLKEYTIGLKVLHKPFNFNPRQDAIVRIHAGRLRRALHQYYQQSGVDDPIFISIPKGCYLPAFSKNQAGRIDEELLLTNEINASKNVTSTGAEKFRVSGELQYEEDRLRITVQMMNTETNEEVWSQIIEYKLSKSEGYEIQDDIAKKLIAAVGEYYRFIKQQVARPSRMAVA
jgi:hypothetical protein